MNEHIKKIREWHRQHEDFVRADGDLERRIKAICRRLTGDIKGLPTYQGGKAREELYKKLRKMDPEQPELAFLSAVRLIQSQKLIQIHRKAAEKQLATLVEQLPVWPWAAEVRGFAHASLARLVGEIGDLSDYPNPAKVWKRMGVGLVVIDGERTRQRRVGGKRPSKSELSVAELHGYSPIRRAILFAACEPLMKQNDHYKAIYDARRSHTLVTHPEWANAKTAEGKATTSYKKHYRFDALRIMSKAFLKDLWVAWGEADVKLSTRVGVSSPPPPDHVTPAAGHAQHETHARITQPRARSKRAARPNSVDAQPRDTGLLATHHVAPDHSATESHGRNLSGAT